MRARIWFWLPVFALTLGLSLLLARREALEPADGTPDRIVLFAPNLNETAYALGHGDKVVAVTDYCVWPPEFLELPRIGGMIDPNLERIVALRPHLLVVQGEAAQLRTFAAEQGIRLAEVKMDDELESIFEGIEELDRVIGGDGTQGRRLVEDLRAGLRELAQQAGETRPTALICFGRAPDSLESLSVIGSSTFLGELLDIAGARNLYADNPQSYFYLSLETLVADPPELVIELRPSASVGDVERERIRSIWRSTLPSVEVAIIDFDGAMIPGPRLISTARAFREAIASFRP